MPRLPPLVLAFAVLLAALPGAAAADGHTRLVQGPMATRLPGPASALGAVIWNHGGDPRRQVDPAPAHFVDQLRDAGFDVWRLERDRVGDTVKASTHALVAVIGDLKQRGYRRIVLAGQSAGGWIALAAAAIARDQVDAVIATAPAAHGRVGDDPAKARLNRDELLQIAGTISKPRVIVFFFAGDEYDPGGRGPALDAVLARRAVGRVVIDEPEGWRGHGAALSRAFARQFGPCIVAFVTARALDDGFACERFPRAGVPYEFALPPGFVPPLAANDNAPLARLVGGWRGSLDNGDDVMLVIESISPDGVRAIFARGRSRPALADRAFTQRRVGHLAKSVNEIVFDEPRLAAISARLDGSSALDLTLTEPTGARRFRGRLQRVE